ncbi:MAG: hypothetical protein U5R30_10340 [Deltaproteobacteria bacterium]|nr:hypothetical protein [Deltaproteobacteria bacterium]
MCHAVGLQVDQIVEPVDVAGPAARFSSSGQPMVSRNGMRPIVMQFPENNLFLFDLKVPAA